MVAKMYDNEIRPINMSAIDTAKTIAAVEKFSGNINATITTM